MSGGGRSGQPQDLGGSAHRYIELAVGSKCQGSRNGGSRSDRRQGNDLRHRLRKAQRFQHRIESQHLDAIAGGDRVWNVEQVIHRIESRLAGDFRRRQPRAGRQTWRRQGGVHLAEPVGAIYHPHVSAHPESGLRGGQAAGVEPGRIGGGGRNDCWRRQGGRLGLGRRSIRGQSKRHLIDGGGARSKCIVNEVKVAQVARQAIHT